MIRDGKEFTKLEGTIGARYAAAAGESPVVCELLEEHYRPRSRRGRPARRRGRRRAGRGRPAGQPGGLLAGRLRPDRRQGPLRAAAPHPGRAAHPDRPRRAPGSRKRRWRRPSPATRRWRMRTAGGAALGELLDLRPHAPGRAPGRRGRLAGGGPGGPARPRERSDRRGRLGAGARRLPGAAGLPAARQGLQALPQHPGGPHARGGGSRRLRGPLAGGGRHSRRPGVRRAA